MNPISTVSMPLTGGVPTVRPHPGAANPGSQAVLRSGPEQGFGAPEMPSSGSLIGQSETPLLTGEHSISTRSTLSAADQSIADSVNSVLSHLGQDR